MPKTPTLFDLISLICTGQINGKSSARPISRNQIGWRLSYNPFCVDTESAETAIVLGEDEVFLILYGDHVAELDGQTRDFAVAYWEDHPELHGATSDTMRNS